jgi:hypothetical protein
VQSINEGAGMTVELIPVSRDELLRRRAAILARIPDLAEFRRRAAEHAITPDERDVLIEREEVDFLLGDDG